MKSRRRAPKKARRPGRSTASRFGAPREWIGGRLSPPFFIHDGEEPSRPDMFVWMEPASELVVGHELVDPEEAEGTLARLLLEAMERPAAGPPRRPGTIRVADASLADELRAALAGTIPIVVAPTPELDDLLELMVETMPGRDEAPGYLEGGSIPPAAVGELFATAQLLYDLAPWDVATDAQVLRLDIPGLGVEGACLSIIGQLGESLGLIIFPSFAGFESFVRAVRELPAGRRNLDLGTGWLALEFESGAEFPASMRREAEERGWPLAGPDAWPRVERFDADGASRPLVERDLKIAAATASALCAFFVKHRSLFQADRFEPVCESYFDNDDLEVRFTLPYEAFPHFDVDEGPAGRPFPPFRRDRPRVGRNAPCPCGSGRKYKKCHLGLDEQEDAARRNRETSHQLDARLVHDLSMFAAERFGDEWRRFRRDFDDAAEEIQLSAHWSVFHFRIQGATVVDCYLEQHGPALPPSDRAWLMAQQASWLSVWEVIEVEPGASLTLRDLLSGETRRVREVSGSEALVVRDAMLGRIVDHDGVSLICGVHLRPLPPLDAAEVVRRARGRLRRKREVPVERLRDEPFGRYLIRRWEEAVAQLDARRAIPPTLQNTDGDALLLTTDHFVMAPGAREAVEERLAALEDVRPPEDGGEEPAVYVFRRPSASGGAPLEMTVIGQAELTESALRIETNSQARADALRGRVEAACGARIRHRAREHTDPLSPKAAAVPHQSQPEPPPEARQILLDFKERHYAEWPDHSLPALGGLTPRKATRTAEGRAAVDVLLKQMENSEQRAAVGEPFDFSGLRRELGLENVPFV